MHRAEHEVAGHGCLDRDVRSFPVADLADKQRVWVAAQNRPEAGGKRQARPCVYVDLHDPFDLVLDRVLDRHQDGVVVVKQPKPGVQRGGLAEACRAAHEDGAIGLGERPGERLGVLGRNAEIGKLADMRRAVEDSQHYLLAMGRWQHRDAEVNRLAAKRDRHATILRSAALDDIKVTHDLEARRDRLHDLGRRCVDAPRHSVDSCANGHLILPGLKMNIRSVLLDRPLQHAVDKLDSRRTIGRGPNVGKPSPLSLGLLLDLRVVAVFVSGAMHPGDDGLDR